jgi:hypothetical protein
MNGDSIKACVTGCPLFDKELGATLERLREIGAFLLPKKFIPL